MLKLILLQLLFTPVLCFAQISSFDFTIRFNVATNRAGHFRIELDEADPRNDELKRMGEDGLWAVLYQGEITYAELPVNSAVGAVEISGERGSKSSLLRQGDYDLMQSHSSGLRFRSGNKLAVVMEHGVAVLPWHGKVISINELDRGTDKVTGFNFAILSVEGESKSGTYLFINDHYEYPYTLLQSHSEKRLKAKFEFTDIVIPALDRRIDPLEILDRQKGKTMRLIPGAKARNKPQVAALMAQAEVSEDEVLKELIAQLDEREPMASAVNAGQQAAKAVQGILVNEFPSLRELQQSDPVVARAMDQVSKSLAELWLSGRIESGKVIKSIVEKRLEALSEDRTACELALMKTSGRGGHATAYLRGEAMRGLNALYRRMYSRK